MPRTLSSISVALFILAQLAPSRPAGSCVHSPPPPVCGKNLTLALAGPTAAVLTGGGAVDVSALVFFSLLDFPQGLGACPAGPYTVDVSVTADCTPGPDGSGQLLGAAVIPGFNNLTVPVTLPAGPARPCALAATATVRLADGMTLTETADNVTCVVDPAPVFSSLPRLGLELLGPAGSEIARTHPGDPTSHTYRITNNDPAESFSGGLTVDMSNEARMPGAAGPMPPGTGVFSISDPVAGDHFAVGFTEDLVEGCLPFTRDPAAAAVPEIRRAIDLAPGGSIDVTVFSRPWGMCADGSCGRSTLTLDGSFSDASPGLACSGFVVAADSGVAPTYGWPDAGEVGEFPPPDDPAKPKIPLTGEPSPGMPVTLDVEALRALLAVDGQGAGAPIVFTDRWNAELGRIQLQFLGPFLDDSTFDFDGEVLFTTPVTGLSAETVTVLGRRPTGFEKTAPAAEVLTKVTDPTGFVADSFFDVTAQVTVVGIDPLGGRRLLEFDDIRFVRRADGSGFDFVLGGGSLPGGTGDDLLAIEASMDLRGFLSPEPQLGVIFEDGFESGNVSAWSLSSP